MPRRSVLPTTSGKDLAPSNRHSRWRVRLSSATALAVATLGLVVVNGLAAPASAGAAPAAPAGFTTTWSDDFSGAANTGVPTATWKYNTAAGSSFGTGEIETTTNSTSNVYEDGAGHLVLKALHSGSDPRSGWTSGRIESQAATFGAPAGGVVRMEASIQQPNLTTANGAGYWPAFWMLGSGLRTGASWPGVGEVDILEDINSRSSVFGTLHCGVSPGGPCNESTGIGSGEHACPGCQTGYHDYAVEIDRSTSPEQVRYYLDGANYFTVTANQVDATTWANAVDHPFFIILDLAIGGGFPDAFGGGPNAATASGGQMNVDWVAVYNKSAGSGTPAPGGADIAQGKPTTASSTENAGTAAANATDGNSGTRWSSASSDPQWLQVDLGQQYSLTQVTLNWEAAYAKAFTIQTSANATGPWTDITPTTAGKLGVQTLAVSGAGRFVRLYATARATPYGDSLWAFSVVGTPANGAATLLSQGKPVTASSTENAGSAAGNAVDGNTGTRWSSAFSDPQWLQVDLGSTHTISSVVLNWEAAYARTFTIQTSASATGPWSDLTPITTGQAGVQTLTVNGSGRYVRMNGLTRATGYGYSLWEFQVLGS